MSTIRIMLVCHGNICRSTMSEFVLKYLVEQRGIADRFVIQSSATSTEEIGNDTHCGTKRVLDAHGIAHPPRRAVQLRRVDADKFDLFIGMDEANVRNMRRILGADAEPKIHLLLEFVGKQRAIADPWYTGDFETTFDDVMEGCEGLLAHLGF